MQKAAIMQQTLTTRHTVYFRRRVYIGAILCQVHLIDPETMRDRL